MTAQDVLNNIMNDENLKNYKFKYCLVNNDKVPFTFENNYAKPNCLNDFKSIDEIPNNLDLSNYRGLGISIQASKVTAIDVDKCFSTPFDVNTGDERFYTIYNLFKNYAYIEFSFSGKGLRLFFLTDNIPNYKERYYIKNSSCNIEFYLPQESYRYVTITGRAIVSNEIKYTPISVVNQFINKYMQRKQNKPHNAKESVIQSNNIVDDKEINKKLKIMLFKNAYFQDLYFEKALGFGTGESEHDFTLLKLIYENITTNTSEVKKIFENSPYFKSKDYQHIDKWNKNNFSYFNNIMLKLSC